MAIEKLKKLQKLLKKEIYEVNYEEANRGKTEKSFGATIS